MKASSPARAAGATPRLASLDRYLDPTHHIHAAQPLADALDEIDRSEDRDAYAELLNAIGKLAGGLSCNGFRADLLAHVTRAEQGDTAARTDAGHDRHGCSRRPDECAPSFDGAEAGDEAAGAWLIGARDALRDRGLAFVGGRIVTATRTAA